MDAAGIFADDHFAQYGAICQLVLFGHFVNGQCIGRSGILDCGVCHCQGGW